MVNVFKVVSFLELGQGKNNNLEKKKKNICIPGAFLEEIKQTEAIFLLSLDTGFMAIYKMVWTSHKNHRHFLSPRQ